MASGPNLSSAEAAWNESHPAPEFNALDPPLTVVLITSNLQQDFFTRFPKRKESMNRYWVGRKESEKVLGVDNRGPLMQLMTWIRAYASTIPPETLVPGFQEELPSAGEQEGGEHNEENELDHDDELEREREKAWEVEGAEEERTTTATNQSQAASPNHATSLLISLAQAATSPVSSSQASLLRSPNVLISPSPAPSSRMSTPSPTSLSSHRGLGTSHRKQHSASSLDGLPPPHLTHVSTASLPALPTVTHTPQGASPSTSPPSGSTHQNTPDFRPSIYVIHLRTCIDKTHATSATSIEKYGEYCLAGSDGIRLAGRMDEDLEKYPNECIINTNRLLSSSTYRALKKKLQQIRSFVRKQNLTRWRSLSASSPAASHHAQHYSQRGSSSSSSSSRRGTPLKLAVIGGWTDEDVYHLCYELRTRVLASSLATCSQLTASPSQSQHWTCLSQLKRVMNVTVTRTIKELIGWFGIGMLPYRLPGVTCLPKRIWPVMEWLNGPSSKPHNFKDDIDGEIMAHLYKNSSRVVIDTLVGGFSPSIVLSINSVDHQGVREAPTVVKLASREDTATEYQAFQRIEEMLGNNAPSIRAFVELGDRGAMKFRYTRMSGGKVRTLRDLFDDLSGGGATAAEALEGVTSSANGVTGSGGNAALIEKMMDEIYGEIFGGWYSAAHTEQFDLYSYYLDGFNMSHGDPVSMVHQDPKYLKGFVSYVLSKPGTAEAPRFKADSSFFAFPQYEEDVFFYPHLSTPLTNLGILFEKQNGMPYLRTLPPRRLYSTFAHGDANLQNFLLDTRGNIWVIDFFFTEPRNHVLRDMSKTWSCVMYIATEITTDRQMAQAVLISEELAAARDLHVPLPAVIPGLTDAMLKAVYSILQRLWMHVGRMVKDRSYAVQFQLALVAEAMRHFLYTTRNMYSKRWALATAVLLSESVLMQEKRIHDVTPSWLTLETVPLARGSLGMTRSPGNRNYMRFERRSEPVVPASGSAAAAATTTPSKPTSSDRSSGKDSGFRRELTQEERALKEHRERVEVTAKHAAMHGAEDSSERAQWRAGIQAEFDALMQTQHSLRHAYEQELLERRTRRARSTQQGDWTGLSRGKALLEEDEEEDDAPEVEHEQEAEGTEQQPDPFATDANDQASTTMPLTKPGHRARDSALSRSGSCAVSFAGASAVDASDSTDGGSTASMLVQSVSHPVLRSQVDSSPLASPTNSVSSMQVGSPASSSVKRMPRLQKECLRLREEGVTHLLLLLTDAEFKEMGVDKAKLHQYMSEYGIQVITVSMPPGIMQVPLLMDLVKYSLGILCDERKFKLVLVSKGGFHRAGTVAACILCAFGQPPEQAIRMVRECRGAQAIGRDSREKVVHKFDLQWKNLLISHIVLQAGQVTQPNEDDRNPTASRDHADTHTFLQPQSYTFV